MDTRKVYKITTGAIAQMVRALDYNLVVGSSILPCNMPIVMFRLSKLLKVQGRKDSGRKA